MAKRKNKKQRNKKPKQAFDENNFMNLLGQMGAPGMEEPKRETGIISEFDIGENYDENFNNNYFLELYINIESTGGKDALENCKRLKLNDTVFLPNTRIYYHFRLPKILINKYIDPSRRRKSEFYISNGYEETNIAQIRSDKYTNEELIEKNKELINVLFFKWSDINSGEVIPTKDSTEIKKFTLHKRILEHILTYDFTYEFKDNMDEFINLIEDYTLNLKNTGDINLMDEKTKKEYYQKEEELEKRIKEFFK